MAFIPGQTLLASDLQAAFDQCLKTGQLSNFMANALVALNSAQALLALGVTDGTGLIPLSLLPSSVAGGLSYKGAWNASTNVPTIPAAAAGNNGWFYIVNTAGTTNIGGIASWAIGDWVVSNGSTWSKVANASAVSSVAGKTGAVTLNAADLVDATTVGKALLLASTVAAQRSALGLGTAALLNGGTSGANNLLQLDSAGRIPALDGSLITNLSTIPAGSLMPFAGATAPGGWLFCDGSAVSRTTYAALFTAISTTHGVGDGTTTFNLPDLRGRVIAGVDNMGGTAANRITSGGAGITGTSLGASGGAETHVLTIGQMPSHTHGLGTKNGTYNTTGAGSGPVDGSGNSAVSNSAGSGNAHNNTQPTIMLNYMIKT